MKLLIALLLTSTAYSYEYKQIGGKLINKSKTQEIYLTCDSYDQNNEPQQG